MNTIQPFYQFVRTSRVILFMLALLLAVDFGVRAQIIIDNTQTISIVQASIQGAINAASSGETVIVTGGKTNANESLNLTIPAGITVKWRATYTGATGTLIALSGAGTFEVEEGGMFSASASGMPIAISSESTIVVSGGTVESLGTAIRLNGATSKIIVSDGTVKTTTGKAIEASGAYARVEISGGTVEVLGPGDQSVAIYANGTHARVEISGGIVRATENNAQAIHVSGVNASVYVSGTALISVTSGYAINAGGAYASVEVSGGIVESTGSGRPIDAGGSSSTITISGTAVVSSVNNIAIHSFNSVQVQGGMVRSSANGVLLGKAITAANSATVTGGVVFAHGNAIANDDIVYVENGPAFTGAVAPGIAIAWDKAAGNTTYYAGNETNIIKQPNTATVYWGGNGIYYEHGANTGTIPVADATVLLSSLSAGDLTYSAPVNTVYNGTSQGLTGSVNISKPNFATTCGTLTVKYASMFDAGSASVTPPVDAGTYIVTAEISGGTLYGAISIVLGNYAITPVPLTLQNVTLAAKTYDGSAVVNATNATFTGLQNSETLSLGADYTVAGMFNSAEVLTANAVSGTVALVPNGPRAKNYTLASGTFNQAATIGKAPVSGISQIYEVKDNLARNYNFDLAALLPQISTPQTFGTIAYSPVISTNTDNVLGALSYVSGNVLVLPVQAVGVGKTAVVTVAVSSDNYQNFNAIITVNSIAKTPVNISGITMSGGAYKSSPYDFSGTPVITQKADGGIVTDCSALSALYDSIGGAYNSATAPTEPGNYRLTLGVPATDPNYSGSVVYHFAVTKKEIIVKADDKTVAQGSVLPVPTVSYAGFVGADTPSSALATEASAHLNVPNCSALGSSPIDFSVHAELSPSVAAHYTLTHVNGTLTVVSPEWVACDVTNVISPSNATISGLNINASVGNETTLVTINVAVSAGATWKLYSDDACTNEIANKTLTLVVGANRAYLRTTAGIGTVSKVYTLTMNRLEAYDIHISAVTGGSVVTDTTRSTVGRSVELTIIPNTDYALDSIVVHKTNDASVVVTLAGTGTARVFTMPAYDVTVTVAFKSTAGVGDVPQKQQLIVRKQNNRLTVCGLAIGKPWSVYSISGRLIHLETANDSESTIILPAHGAYIILSGDRAVKTMY